jgi:prevent-host-death family protein
MAMSSRSVGIRELKDHASEILHAVQNGATIRVTDRRRPIALIVPVSAKIDASERLEALVRAGIIAYGGGKPRGLSDARDRQKHSRSADVAGAVIEDRR